MEWFACTGAWNFSLKGEQSSKTIHVTQILRHVSSGSCDQTQLDWPHMWWHWFVDAKRVAYGLPEGRCPSDPKRFLNEKIPWGRLWFTYLPSFFWEVTNFQTNPYPSKRFKKQLLKCAIGKTYRTPRYVSIFEGKTINFFFCLRIHKSKSPDEVKCQPEECFVLGYS